MLADQEPREAAVSCEAVMLQKEGAERDREKADSARRPRTFAAAGGWSGDSARVGHSGVLVGRSPT